MSNVFYNVTGTPGTGAAGASAPIRAEFAAIAAGFALIPTKVGSCVLFILKSANMNSTSDQQFTANLFSSGTYRIDEILAYNSTGAVPSTAVGGIYVGASKTGTVIIPAAETYASITAAGLIKVLDFSSGASLVQYSTAPYLSLTVAQGATSTLDFAIMGTILP